MTPDYATKEDLLKLQMELTNADTRDRHEIKNLIAEDRFNLDEYKTDQALIKQTQKTMQKEISEIKTEMKEGFKEIKDLFNRLPENFATKEEHRSNAKNLATINKILWGIGSIIGAAIIGAILNLILK